MATGQDILSAAQVKYPSWVRGGNWYDLSPPVRVVDTRTGKECGIWLLDPVAGMAILNGGTDEVSVKDFVITERQGRIKGSEITEPVMDTLERFLNIVSDERMQNPNGDGQVQTPNAVAARTFLDDFYMRREKGLSYEPKSGS